MTTTYEKRMAELGIDRGSLAKGFRSDLTTVQDQAEPELIDKHKTSRIREADLPAVEPGPIPAKYQRESTPAPPPAPGPGKRNAPLTPEEIRALAAKGLCTAPGIARPVEKNGTPVATQGSLMAFWMDITPALAKRWLANNFRNRPLREDTVTAYARDMKNGAWVATHQGLAFNDRDELIDGQHRLHAVIQAGVTVRMMVTFGLPSQIKGHEMTTMDAVDRGATRSVADQLKIQHGLSGGSILAAVCVSLASVCVGERTRRLSVGQTLDVYRQFQMQIDFVLANRSKRHGFKSAGVLAAFIFAMATEKVKPGPESKVAQWFIDLNTSVDKIAAGAVTLDAMSPLARLHDLLTSPDALLLSRGTDRGMVELTLQALHLQQKGGQCYQLKPDLAGVEHFKALQRDRVEKIAALFRLPK